LQCLCLTLWYRGLYISAHMNHLSLRCVVAVCCSVLQCVAVCCSNFDFPFNIIAYMDPHIPFTRPCGVLHCVAVCSCTLQCIAVYCSALLYVAVRSSELQCFAARCSAFQCVAVASRLYESTYRSLIPIYAYTHISIYTCTHIPTYIYTNSNVYHRHIQLFISIQIHTHANMYCPYVYI